MRKVCGVLSSIAVATSVALSSGPAAAQAADFKGTRDPDGFKRFSGSQITAQRAQNFVEFDLVVGKADWEDTSAPKPVKALEGRHVRTVYLMPAGVSSLEAYRNYESEFASMGMEILFKCRNPGTQAGDCGRRLVGGKMYTAQNWIQNQAEAAKWVGSGAEDLAYLAGRIPRPSGDLYVALFTVKLGGSLNRSYEGRTAAVLDVVQVKALEEKMAFVDAATMQGEIEKAGRVSLYGILFDTNSAKIRQESGATIAEVAKLLTRNAAWKLVLIGHTDNVGGAEFNQSLSLQRARAVAAALTGTHKIAPNRVRAEGKGMSQPVATNDTEEGRAKNRRVELVRE